MALSLSPVAAWQTPARGGAARSCSPQRRIPRSRKLGPTGPHGPPKRGPDRRAPGDTKVPPERVRQVPTSFPKFHPRGPVPPNFSPLSQIFSPTLLCPRFPPIFSPHLFPAFPPNSPGVSPPFFPFFPTFPRFPSELSAAGSRLVDAELERALQGVRSMEALLERSDRGHRQLLRSLELAQRGKEEAVQLARQKEQELSARGERCNASVQALWESCKPCLRQRCLRFYSRTCRSGAGLVGRQLEEFLNHSSPISIWVDGERLDSLLERDERQERQLQELEERFGLLEDGVQDIFRDSSRVQGRLHPFFQAPFGGFREAPAVQRLRLPRRFRRFSGDFFPFFPQRRGGFQQLFQPLFQITQRMLEDAQGGWENPSGEFGTESRNFSNDRMVCREIRRNSAGCLRMRDECEQCREILALDCGQEDPSQQELREQLEDAVRVAERFTRRYDSLLREFQEEMLNTSGLLDQLNRQFGWVSRLANHSMGSDGFLQVTTVLSKAPNPEDPSAPPDTQVTVQLFDSEPLALTVPGDVPWDHPRFMEIVAQQALQHFKENAIE
ncbi:clusterin [Serinus canaria]|uniref:clusterin n=1 Tax=Serinus canaria TaxID=9135 RepID=UPI0021CD1813|nr:clusterin [Serinus canaria]